MDTQIINFKLLLQLLKTVFILMLGKVISSSACFSFHIYSSSDQRGPKWCRSQCNQLVWLLGIIIITDGVTSVPDVAMCETLLNQLRSGTIACSFVQVSMKYVQNCQLAIVTYEQSNQSLWKWIVIRDESLHQTVSFQVGGAYSYDCSFGYIPNVELMKFISLATFGSYLPSCPEVDFNSPEMNIYHRALLTYSFLKTPESMNSEYFCGTCWFC